MNANELLHYLRGFSELVDQPSPAQWAALRNEILRASSVENQFIPVPMQNTPSAQPCAGCGGKSPQPAPEGAPIRADSIPRGYQSLT